MDSIESGSKKSHIVEFPEMPGVVFVVAENEKRTKRDGVLLAEWMVKVAAEIWFGRSVEDRQRVIDEVRRMAEISDATLAYVLHMMERDDAKQDSDLPTITVRGSKD